MKIKDLFFIQFIAWVIFTVVDFIKETIDIDFQVETCYAVSIMLVVLYFIRRKFLWNGEKRRPVKKQIKQLALLIAKWSFITIISTIVISVLVLNDFWIVSQHTDLLNLLNGLEYTIFGYDYLLIVPIVFILIGEFLLFLVVKCISYFRKQ